MRLIERWGALTPVFHALLRIVTGFLFIWPGSMKLFAYPIGMPGGMKAPLLSQIGIGGVLEFLGGILLVLGLGTRATAFILSGEMAVAYWQFHAPKSLWPIVNGGGEAALYCFVFLFFSAAGAGPWSLDALRSRGREN